VIPTRALAAAALGLLLGTLPAPAAGAGEGDAGEVTGYAEGRRLCRLANRRVVESSGVAASRLSPGVFWTHNDSGDRARLFAFNAKGEELGEFDVEGDHRDWEDICAYVRDGKGYIVVGDTGDNVRRHDDYVLYVYEEPRLPAPAGGKAPPPRLVETVVFTYGDGESHDGESLAAEPDGRVLYIVTRNREAPLCRAFRLERYRDEKGTRLREEIVAQEIATLKYQDVSAADISPDGRRMLVQTCDDAYEYLRGAGQSWKDALKRKPKTVALPGRAKGEGATYGPGGDLYLTSEGFDCPLFVVPAKRAERRRGSGGG
jgi:hypothetical protein